MADQLNGNQLTYVDVKFDVPCGSKSERKNQRIKVGGGGWVESGMRQREGPASPVSGREGERSHHLNPLKFTT